MGVFVGVFVIVGVFVRVGVNVGVIVFVGVEVLVDVDVGVGLCVGLDVAVGVRVGAGVQASPVRKQLAEGVVFKLNRRPSLAASAIIPGSIPAKRRMPHAP